MGSGGYWMFPTLYSAANATTGGATSANHVRCSRAAIPVSIAVSSVHFSVGATQAGGGASVVVYSDDGNTKLIDSGAKSTARWGRRRRRSARP